MQRQQTRLWPAVLGLFAIALSGCSSKGPDALAAKLGKPCTVQFRRNLLGAASNSPVSPTAGMVNGVEFSVSGTLSQASDSWIILNAGQRDYCIPRENVLLMEVSTQ